MPDSVLTPAPVRTATRRPTRMGTSELASARISLGGVTDDGRLATPIETRVTDTGFGGRNCATRRRYRYARWVATRRETGTRNRRPGSAGTFVARGATAKPRTRWCVVSARRTLRWCAALAVDLLLLWLSECWPSAWRSPRAEGPREWAGSCRRAGGRPEAGLLARRRAVARAAARAGPDRPAAVPAEAPAAPRAGARPAGRRPALRRVAARPAAR